MKKLSSLALATLFFTTNLCATKTRLKPRMTEDDKIWQATAVVIENTAWWSAAFLVLGYLASSQVEAERRVKWGAICGLLVGVYRAAAKYRETTSPDFGTGSSQASDQKLPQQQTEQTSAGN